MTAAEVVLLGIALVAVSVLAIAMTLRWLARRLMRALSRRLGAVTAPTGWSRTGSAWLPGPGREVAGVRRALRSDLDATTRVLRYARGSGRGVEPLQSIVRQLGEQARELDVDLAIIAAEPHAPSRRTMLGGQRERLELLHAALGDVRQAALVAGETGASVRMTAAIDELHDEVIAIGLRAQAHRELSGR